MHMLLEHVLMPVGCVCVCVFSWISVLTNSKEEALNMAFRGEQTAGDDSLEDLTKAIIDDVLRMPGNEMCCDCGAPGQTAVCVFTRKLEWVSVYHAQQVATVTQITRSES